MGRRRFQLGWSLREGLDPVDAGSAGVHSPSPLNTEGPQLSSHEETSPVWRFDEHESSAVDSADTLRVAEPSGVAPESAFEYQFDADVAAKVVVGSKADDRMVEEFRKLAAVLHHAQMDRGVRSVMVASAAAGEGKTLVATNLALTLSHSYQRRVLLIDADLRNPDIHHIFRLPNSVGLADGLKQPDRGQLPVHRISPRLWVLSGGEPDPDPMSGLVSGTMKQLVTEATSQFDWVVLDTPPLALMPDANLLGAMIDGALLVVGANSTPYPLVKRAMESIGGSRVLGVVLNKVQKSDLEAQDSYYYHYYRRRPNDDGERPTRGFPLFGSRYR